MMLGTGSNVRKRKELGFSFFERLSKSQKTDEAPLILPQPSFLSNVAKWLLQFIPYNWNNQGVDSVKAERIIVETVSESKLEPEPEPEPEPETEKYPPFKPFYQENYDLVWRLLEANEPVDFTCLKQLIQNLIEHSCFQQAEALIAKDLNINQKDGSGQTLLHHAVKNGDESIVKGLIGLGALVDAKDDLDVTPLHLACLKGHGLIVKILVRNGANVRMVNQNSCTPLNIAFRKNNEKQKKSDYPSEIILILLNEGAQFPSIQPQEIYNMMFNAVKYNELALLEAYVKKTHFDINTMDNNQNTLLHTIVARRPSNPPLDAPNVVQTIIRLGGNVKLKDPAGNTALHYACNAIDVKTLVRSGGCLQAKNNHEWTPLFSAVGQKKQTAVEELLNQGADPYSYVGASQKNIMHIAKNNNRHSDFSKWMKTKITLPPVFLRELEASFFSFFEQCYNYAQSTDKKLTILLGESHGEYRGYQIEKAVLKAAERVNVTHLFIEQNDLGIKNPKNSPYMPLSYASRHLKFTIIASDIYSRQGNASSKVDVSCEGMMLRNMGINEIITDTNQHGVGIYGANHLEGLLQHSATKLDSKSHFIVPISAVCVNEIYFGSRFYQNLENVIQVDIRRGLDNNQAMRVIRKWNGVDLQLPSKFRI